MKQANQTRAFDAALGLIFQELERAEQKHGDFPDDLIHAVGILEEEVGEAMREAIDLEYMKAEPGQGGLSILGSIAGAAVRSKVDAYQRELAQAGAMALRALAKSFVLVEREEER